MLDTHRDVSPDDWKVFATGVKDVMCEKANLRNDHTAIREKLVYEDFMTCLTHEVTIDGVRYTGDKYRPEREILLKH